MSQLVNSIARILRFPTTGWLFIAAWALVVLFVSDDVFKGWGVLFAVCTLFGSSVSGVWIGRRLGAFIGRFQFMKDHGRDERMGEAASIFLFLFLPVLVWDFVLEGRTSIKGELMDLTTAFYWALFWGVLVSFPKRAEKDGS